MRVGLIFLRSAVATTPFASPTVLARNDQPSFAPGFTKGPGLTASRVSRARVPRRTSPPPPPAPRSAGSSARLASTTCRAKNGACGIVATANSSSRIVPGLSPGSAPHGARHRAASGQIVNGLGARREFLSDLVPYQFAHLCGDRSGNLLATGDGLAPRRPRRTRSAAPIPGRSNRARPESPRTPSSSRSVSLSARRSGEPARTRTDGSGRSPPPRCPRVAPCGTRRVSRRPTSRTARRSKTRGAVRRRVG